jgi:hypothetical protein
MLMLVALGVVSVTWMLVATRIAVADPRRPGDPPVDRVIGAMAATRAPCAVHVAVTPVPALFELYSQWLYRGRKTPTPATPRRAPTAARPLVVVGAELRAGLHVRHPRCSPATCA